MRLIAAVLVAMLIAIQWPLWFGRGGWLRVWDLQRQLDAQRSANATAQSRNDALATEISSLKQGREAIEERARGELHMMRADETFFQWLPAAPAEPKASGGK
ncbi:MAG TPA: cell division protein FtsB [Burkholderiaceae bacterium]